MENGRGSDEAISSSFDKFRPLCVHLTRHHTRDNVSRLRDLVKAENPTSLQQLLEYILFPLRLILKQSTDKSENLYIDVISCMRLTLTHATITRSQTLRDLFTSLCQTLSVPSHDNLVGPVSEELKLEVVKCLQSVITATDNQCVLELYSVDFLPVLGHAVSLLLAMTSQETDRKLRVASVQCIAHLAAVDRTECTDIQQAAGQTMASFLPGITLTLTKVITGDSKQGQLVISTALKTWSQVVILVMGDSHINQPDTDSSVQSSGSGHKLSVRRDTEWVTGTSEKLSVLIRRITPVASHSTWRVRQAVVVWADSLLTHCSKSLHGNVADFLEVLVSGVGDEYEAVSKSSHQGLARCRERGGEGALSLITVLGENLHKLCTHLPRLIRKPDDDDKLASLQLLLGYLTLLGHDLTSLLQSSSHLHRLLMALVQVLEFSCSHVTVIQEKTTVSSEIHTDSLSVQQPGLRKTFKNFSDDRVLHCIVQVCHKLGHYGDIHLIVDHLLDLFHQSSIYRKQAVYLLQHTLAALTDHPIETRSAVDAHHNSSVQLESLIRLVVESLVDPAHFKLPVSSSDASTPSSTSPSTSSTSPSVEQLNSNIVQTCLILDAITTCADVLTEGISVLLMELLYIVVEKVSSESAHVSHTALSTLTHIAQATKHSSVAELLCHNADYLVNSISRRLRRIHLYPQSPSVLAVVIKYSNPSILPLLQDVLQEVLVTLDATYLEGALGCLRVLHTLVTSIGLWFPDTQQQSSEDLTKTSSQHPSSTKSPTSTKSTAARCKSTSPKSSTPSDISQFIIDYHQQKQRAEDLINDDDQDEEDPPRREEEEEGGKDEWQEEQNTPPPLHIELVKKVCERCRHLLAHGDKHLRVLLLDTVSRCCLALLTQKNELLPQLHLLWPSVVRRLSDEDNPVVVKAIHTVQTFSQVGGDFVRQRLVKDAFPHITASLQKYVKTGLKTGQAYRFTQTCRLQLTILQNIAQLCLQSDVREHQLYGILEACAPYLSAAQPLVLQQAAIEAFIVFHQLDPDIVWLLLTSLRPSDCRSPPHSSLHPVMVTMLQHDLDIDLKSGSQCPEFTANIEQIWSNLHHNQPS